LALQALIWLGTVRFRAVCSGSSKANLNFLKYLSTKYEGKNLPFLSVNNVNAGPSGRAV